MSDLLKPNGNDADCKPNKCEAIKHIIEAKDKDLGGFSVRRLLPVANQKMVGPWIFFDHMGPAQFEPGQGINVRPHPHIHLATVTYLFDGEILHRDSLGSLQAIVPGDINLMVAGKGITHSERERPEVRDSVHTAHGLQLWLALPQAQENCEPAFYHYPKDKIPQTTIDGVEIRVMMGEAFGLISPVKTFADTIYIEAHMQAGQSMVLPNAKERGVYIAKGELQALDTTLNQHTMTIFEQNDRITLTAKKETRLAMIGGEPLGKRYIEWNFVSSSLEAIQHAKQQWSDGKFDKVVGDEDEFIPLPS